MGPVGEATTRKPVNSSRNTDPCSKIMATFSYENWTNPSLQWKHTCVALFGYDYPMDCRYLDTLS